MKMNQTIYKNLLTMALIAKTAAETIWWKSRIALHDANMAIWGASISLILAIVSLLLTLWI